MEPVFSILVVCLNPGDKLRKTLESIEKQTFEAYEVVIKDGLSTDESLQWVKDTDLFPALRLIEKKDSGIYDAMNQAAEEAKGRYLYYLNCGDVFYREDVLEKVYELITKNVSGMGIYYGNIYERRTGQVVASNPRLDAFGCYRNVPCHQACFYDRRLLLAHPFETKYRVRADYEQFLWCFFTNELQEKVNFIYGEILIADYEGGGFSETRENRKISAREHKEIVRKYMPAGKVWKYRLLMAVTLAPLRTWIAANPVTSGLYNRLKKSYYGKGVK
ncbi:MAG: glycosyltransferase [Blautia sp.]|nr:glycosyltransferase [Lachnoclostridium sp.]MCM1212015.1 glycosyltransferase [Blautia sp.]